jgi:t-SNARE complex subunit (syntaxin)
MQLGLAEDGFAAINKKIDEVQKSVEAGVLDPEKAVGACREARSELFGLRQIIQEKVTVGPDRPAA